LADKKISDLGALTTADATDVVPLVDVSASVTKKVTVAGLASAMASNIPAGSLTYAQGDGKTWWEEIGRTTLVAAGDSISVTGLPARKYLMVIFNVLTTGGTVDSRVRFNNDATNVYSSRISVNNGASTGTTGEASGAIGTAIATSSFIRGSFEIINVASNTKIGFGEIVAGSALASSAPDSVDFTIKWVNAAAQINRVDILNIGSGDYGIGSELIILGHN
jgi:hypothetical protein